MLSKVQTGCWGDLAKAATQVRYAVFVLEQKVPADIELDELDSLSDHAVLFEQDQPVATGRLLPDAHIGRMAVLASHRGQGYGALILKALMALAKQRGDTMIYLSAQLQAQEFYARYGFEAYGDTYLDAGIVHRMMRCAI